MTAEIPTKMPAAPKRVLIILLGAIGDVVRALPLLGRIRRAWPQAHIAWAVEPKSKPMIEGHRWLDQLIVYDRRYAPWSFAPFLGQVRAGHFDLVVDLQRHLKSGIIDLVSGARDRLGFAAANTKEFNHRFTTRQIKPQPAMRLKLMQYQAFADALGAPPAPIEFGLSLPPEEDARARAMVAGARRPLVGVILGSSWPSRIYFPESVAAVIRELARPAAGSAPLYPVLIGAAEEAAIGDAVMRNLDGLEVLNLVGRTRLRDLIGIFSECAVAFGPDSGPMHLAASVGVPCVIAFSAHGLPGVWYPAGRKHQIIYHQPECFGCGLETCIVMEKKCMTSVTVDEMEQAADRVLGPLPQVLK